MAVHKGYNISTSSGAHHIKELQETVVELQNQIDEMRN